MKQYVYLIFLSLLAACNLFSNKDGLTRYEGSTMGTTYHITFLNKEETDIQQAIDSILIALNNALSTYISTSTISKVNRADTMLVNDIHFIAVFEQAKKVYKKTDGFFDPTVMPLVNYWGFGVKEKSGHFMPDSSIVDSLRVLVGFDKVLIKEASDKNAKIIIKQKHQTLDFSAIAKGYAVDVIAKYLMLNGIVNYLVEIGGELSVKGKKNKNTYWKVGIDKPVEKITAKREIKTVLTVKDKSIATSGNYRNYYMQNDKKYVHTIHPQTGYPVITDVLSVSVITDHCITADAYATAFMVMGVKKALKILNADAGLEACFLYIDSTGKEDIIFTSGLERAVVSKISTKGGHSR